MHDDDEERIRAKAYALWEAEGRPDGRADAHWAMARALVLDIDIDEGRQPASLPVQDDLREDAPTQRPAEPAATPRSRAGCPSLTDQDADPPKIGREHGQRQ